MKVNSNIQCHLIFANLIADQVFPNAQKNKSEFKKEYPHAFNWVAEEIALEDWNTFRKTMRNPQDIQQRWNNRLERNRIKNSVDGLGKEKAGKKL